MPELPETDALLIDRVREGRQEAWEELIVRFEGRLLAYVERRLGNRAAAEDVVQETLVGLLTSLPHYDRSRSLESYLFSIAAHKLTDHLRREGRRPALPFSAGDDTSGGWEPVGRARHASSIARSGERRGLEAALIEAALRSQLDAYRRRGDWSRIACLELLFVRGMPNKEVAVEMGFSEQQVANAKFDFLQRLRAAVQAAGAADDTFAELNGNA
jgi:RNA polymerase sigma-70 factor (ECF subfamily)